MLNSVIGEQVIWDLNGTKTIRQQIQLLIYQEIILHIQVKNG